MGRDARKQQYLREMREWKKLKLKKKKKEEKEERVREDVPTEVGGTKRLKTAGCSLQGCGMRHPTTRLIAVIGFPNAPVLERVNPFNPLNHGLLDPSITPVCSGSNFQCEMSMSLSVNLKQSAVTWIVCIAAKSRMLTSTSSINSNYNQLSSQDLDTKTW